MPLTRVLQLNFQLAGLIFVSAHIIRAQDIQFVDLPETVTEGTDDVSISWIGGAPGMVCTSTWLRQSLFLIVYSYG